MLRRRLDGADEHFAERLFAQRAFIPICETKGLRLLESQVSFMDSESKQRRIDFVLHG